MSPEDSIAKRLDSTDEERSEGEEFSEDEDVTDNGEISGEEDASGNGEISEEDSGEESCAEGSSDSDNEDAIAELDSDDDFQGDEGEDFGEYRLLERLGKGGYSVVWKAQKNDDAPVALKIGKQDVEDLEQDRSVETAWRTPERPDPPRRVADHRRRGSPGDRFQAVLVDLKTHTAEAGFSRSQGALSWGPSGPTRPREGHSPHRPETGEHPCDLGGRQCHRGLCGDGLWLQLLGEASLKAGRRTGAAVFKGHGGDAAFRRHLDDGVRPLRDGDRPVPFRLRQGRRR